MQGRSSAERVYMNGTDMSKLIRDKMMFIMEEVRHKRAKVSCLLAEQEEINRAFDLNGYSTNRWNPRNRVYRDFDLAFRDYWHIREEIQTLKLEVSRDEYYVEQLHEIYARNSNFGPTYRKEAF